MRCPAMPFRGTDSGCRYNAHASLPPRARHGFSPLLRWAHHHFADEALRGLRDQHFDAVGYVVWLQHLGVPCPLRVLRASRYTTAYDSTLGVPSFRCVGARHHRICAATEVSFLHDSRSQFRPLVSRPRRENRHSRPGLVFGGFERPGFGRPESSGTRCRARAPRSRDADCCQQRLRPVGFSQAPREPRRLSRNVRGAHPRLQGEWLRGRRFSRAESAAQHRDGPERSRRGRRNRFFGLDLRKLARRLRSEIAGAIRRFHLLEDLRPAHALDRARPRRRLGLDRPQSRLRDPVCPARKTFHWHSALRLPLVRWNTRQARRKTKSLRRLYLRARRARFSPRLRRPHRVGSRRSHSLVLFLSRRYARVDFLHRRARVSRALHARQRPQPRRLLLVGPRHRGPRHLGCPPRPQIAGDASRTFGIAAGASETRRYERTRGELANQRCYRCLKTCATFFPASSV